jgi:hypothetical protein
MDDLIARLWQELIDKDDRNSPEEYPEMALITFDEFADYIKRVLIAADALNALAGGA